MHIPDLKAYADNAMPFQGERQVAQSRGDRVRSTPYNPASQVVADSEAESLSRDIYKGNFIDIYV